MRFLLFAPVTTLSFLFLLLHTTLSAQTPPSSTTTLTPSSTTPPLIVSPSGYYYLQPGTDGVPQINPVPVVIKLGTPDDPGDPDDPSPEKLEDRVEKWARATNDPTALKPLSTLYTQIASLIESGSLSPDQAKLAISFGVDALLTQLGTKDKWTTFQSNLSSALDQSSEPLATLYSKVATGLTQATAPS